jgi:hypothetical protein
MLADSVMQLERAYLERLIMWGGVSIIAGTAVMATLTVWRARSPLLTHFALQNVLWGVGACVVGAVRWRVIPLRDLASATRLDQLLWFNAGLDVGIVAVGVALTIAALKLGPRQGLAGAALALIVQGAALFAIHGRLMVALRV